MAGWKTITFTFDEEAPESQVDIDGKQWVIGMDNLYRIGPDSDATFPEGLRAHWEGQDTLVVGDNWIGQMAHATCRIRLSEGAVDLIDSEKFSGSTIEFHGYR